MLTFIFNLQVLFCLFFFLKKIIHNLPQLKKIFFYVIFLKLILILFSDYLPILDYGMSKIWEIKAYEFFLYRQNMGAIQYPEIVYTYSFIVSYIYEIIGRNPKVIMLIGVFFSILTSVIAYYLTKIIYNSKKISKNIFIIISFYPVLVNYSILTMREVYIVFFLILQFFLFSKYFVCKTKKKYFFFISSILVGYAHYKLHGALVVVSFLFFIFFFSNELSRFKFLKIRTRIVSFIIILFLFFFILVFFIYIIPKVSYINQIHFASLLELNFNQLTNKLYYYQTGIASYPDFLIPSLNNKYEFIILIPFRIVYFLLSPFFWDIKKFTHILGYIDGFFYLFIIYLLISKRKFIFQKKIIVYFIITLIILVIIFSHGTGNFGSAIRHRAKFLPLFCIITAPYLSFWFDKLILQLKKLTKIY